MGRKVVLVDKGQIASGTTSRSTALVRTHYSNEIVARMALYSLRTFGNFKHIGDAGFVKNGVFFMASRVEKDAISANVAMLARIGVKSEVLSKDETRRKFPELYVDDCDYFLFEPESGYADPVGTAVAYSKKAEELGAEILLGNGVSRLTISNHKLEGVELTDGRRIACSKAILCTNVWTNKLLVDSGLSDEGVLPLWAVAHPVITMKRPQSYLGLRTTVVDLPNKAYFKPEGQSLLFGGSLDAEIDKQRVDPEQCPAEVPFEFMTYYSEVITKRIPLMASGVMHSSYVGMYDMTPDQHPIMDSLTELGVEGAYCCVGLSGHGFKLCPALGLMNAEMLAGKDPSELMFDRRYFSLQRFREGKLLTTRYSGVGTIA